MGQNNTGKRKRNTLCKQLTERKWVKMTHLCNMGTTKLLWDKQERGEREAQANKQSKPNLRAKSNLNNSTFLSDSNKFISSSSSINRFISRAISSLSRSFSILSRSAFSAISLSFASFSLLCVVVADEEGEDNAQYMRRRARRRSDERVRPVLPERCTHITSKRNELKQKKNILLRKERDGIGSYQRRCKESKCISQRFMGHRQKMNPNKKRRTQKALWIKTQSRDWFKSAAFERRQADELAIYGTQRKESKRRRKNAQRGLNKNDRRAWSTKNRILTSHDKD